MNDAQMREVYEMALARAEQRVLKAELECVVVANPDDAGLAEATLEQAHNSLARLERHFSQTARGIAEERAERRRCD